MDVVLVRLPKRLKKFYRRLKARASDRITLAAVNWIGSPQVNADKAVCASCDLEVTAWRRLGTGIVRCIPCATRHENAIS